MFRLIINPLSIKNLSSSNFYILLHEKSLVKPYGVFSLVHFISSRYTSTFYYNDIKFRGTFESSSRFIP